MPHQGNQVGFVKTAFANIRDIVILHSILLADGFIELYASIPS
jgi:hypothetical protein